MFTLAENKSGARAHFKPGRSVPVWNVDILPSGLTAQPNSHHSRCFSVGDTMSFIEIISTTSSYVLIQRYNFERTVEFVHF